MAAAGAVETAVARPRAAWIGSPAWDLWWMFSGLWGGALLLAASAFADVTLLETAFLALLVRLFVSVAHSWSTTWMVLFSPLLRRERRARPGRYRQVPLALVALSLALGLGVAGWQRFPADGRFGAGLWIFGLYVALFWVGHFWHFGNQDFGVLTLYRLKAGQTRSADRRVDKLYTMAMMFLIQPIVYLSIVRSTAFAEMVTTWLPVSAAGLWLAARAAVAAAALLTLGAAAFELAKQNRSLPKLLYYGVCFLHAALLFGAAWADEPVLAILYVVAYLWSHWFIAIGLVSRINAGYYRSRGDSPARSLLRHAAVVGSIAAAVCALTLPWLDYGLFNTDGFRYKEILAGIGPGQTLWVGGLLGFFLAEQLLHYYCDRCLFRFRDPDVRARVAPLLLG